MQKLHDKIAVKVKYNAYGTKKLCKAKTKSSGKVEQTNSDAVNEKDIVLQTVPQKPAKRQNRFDVFKRHRRNIV